MELYQVDKDTFQIGAIIEGWSSLIWTERYQEFGDFELHSNYISETRAKMPLLSLITLRQSKVIMIVESYEISVGTDGTKEIVVKGRSMDSILESRIWVSPVYNKRIKIGSKNPDSSVVPEYGLRNAILIYLWNSLRNDTHVDALSFKVDDDFIHNNVVPNLRITDSAVYDGTEKKRKVETGVVYDKISRWLSQSDLGIRIIRPTVDSIRVFSMDMRNSSGNISPTIVKTDETNLNKCCVDVYNGKDKTGKVVFNFSRGHLLNPRYFFEAGGYRNLIYLDSDASDRFYRTFKDPAWDDWGDASFPQGLYRRETYLDGGEKDSDDTLAEWQDDLVDEGQRKLKHRYARKVYCESDISPDVPYKYNNHYKLGDKVTLIGEYGGTQDMWVTEYIRAQDETGEIGYPTLSKTLK